MMMRIFRAARSTTRLAALLSALALSGNPAFSQNNPDPAPSQPATKPSAPAPGNAKPGSTTRPATPPATPPAPGSNQAPESGQAPASDTDKLVYVTMKTSKGDIVIELNREKAPITVANFLNYVDRKFYDGTVIHRVVKKPPTMIGVIQGGGFTKELVQKATDAPIKNEWQNGLKNLRGTISMARLPAPDSASSQFFINSADNPLLDTPQGGAAYAVFGKVVAGMGAVDAIQAVKTTTKGRLEDTPVDAVLVESVTRTPADDARQAIDKEKASTT